MRWHIQRHGTRHLLGVMLAVLCLIWPAAAGANSSIAQGFQAGSSGIVSGALVSLRAGTGNTVELSTVDNREQLLGVAATQSLLEFENGSPVQVVTSGATATLVSDINGDIKSGDKITSSPIIGVGMKATESSMVIGSAQDDFKEDAAEERIISTRSGERRTVHIGAIPLLVTPSFYDVSNTNGSTVSSVLQDFASSLAGQHVSPVRVLMAGLLVGLLFVVVAILLYSAVHSSIISIGRNPLSEVAVHRSLLEVGVTILGVLAFTVIVVYLILTA